MYVMYMHIYIYIYKGMYYVPATVPFDTKMNSNGRRESPKQRSPNPLNRAIFAKGFHCWKLGPN